MQSAIPGNFPELHNPYGIDSPLLGPLAGLAYFALFAASSDLRRR